MIHDIDWHYGVCRNSQMLLHRVECSCAARLDRAIVDARRLLPAEEPDGERLCHQLARARWEALAEVRCPGTWYEEHVPAMDGLEKRASQLGVASRVVEELRSAALIFAGLRESPLMGALRSLITDSCWTPSPHTGVTLLVPYGCTRGTLARRVERLTEATRAAGLQACVCLTLGELRHSRLHLGNAIFLGSPGAFGQSVVTCPVASNSFFVFYDFIRVTGEDSEWSHACQDLAPEGAELPVPHWPNFQRFVHEHDCPSRTYALEPHEVDDVEVFAVPSLKERVSRAWSGEDDPTAAEAEECTLIDLAGGLWAGLHGTARKLACDSGHWKLMEVGPDELDAGDLILLLAREPTSHADRTQAQLEKEHGKGLELWRTAQALGREWIDAHGWPEVKEDLVAKGIGAPYEYWFDEGRLGPSSEDTFRDLLRIMGLDTEEASRAWEAMRAWQSYRIQAGHHLAGRFQKEAVRTVQNEGPPNDALRVVRFADPADGSYALIYVEGVAYQGRLPSGKTCRILTSQGKPWCDPDPTD